MKLLCLYQVMFHYRVGTYEAISKLPNVDFELWHGKDIANTKKTNYKGNVGFRHRELPTILLPFKTNNGKGKMPLYPFLFFRLIKYNPDVILAEGASSIFVETCAFLYAKLFKKKFVVWTLGGLKGREHKGIRGLLQHWISYMDAHSDAVFVYSNQGKQFLLKEGVANNRIFVGINVLESSAKIEEKMHSSLPKLDGYNVVFVGAINKTKRLELLVDAVKDLSAEGLPIVLHVIGSGDYMDTLKQYVISVDIASKVVFHGRVTEGLTSMISRYQVMVLPGLGGLAIVDGMIAALPIISGPADGTELDLIDEKNGFVFTTPITKNELVEKLRYLYDNPEVCASLGASSFEKITHELSFNSYMGILNDCLRSVYPQD